MLDVFRHIHVILWILLLCDVMNLQAQRYNNKNKAKNQKPAGNGGRFAPGRVGNSKPYYPPRSRRPTLGDVLSKTARKNKPKKPKPGRNNQSNNQYNNPQANNNKLNANQRNQMQNINRNNRMNGNSVGTSDGVSVYYPNIGKIIPPLVRSQGEKPPFSPSWTHCVISLQVSIAWVVVKSPRYPNKFQGQVQCSWIATAMEGYRVRLSFKDLDLLPPNSKGCGSQFVELIDNELEKSQARFCGTDIPGDYVSSGDELRLDLQADAISTPYRGFLAAFRADREIPGRRETSYFAHGIPSSPYNPLTEGPPSNFRPATRRLRPTRAPTAAPYIPGQNIYGAKNQRRIQENEQPKQDSMASSTTHLYIIIAVIITILAVAAIVYFFRRFFLSTFKNWKKRLNSGEQDENEMDELTDVYKGRQLPGNMPAPPLPPINSNTNSLTRSVSFIDDMYHDNQAFISDENYAKHPRDIAGYGSLHRSHSLNDLTGKPWMETTGEPIYEDDDAMSVHSHVSVRSSNRHPEHESFKRQKILERQNSLRMRRNSLPNDFVPAPSGFQGGGYNPYQTNSLYGPPQNYPIQDPVYGSLPPTNNYSIYGGYMDEPPSYSTYSMYGYPMTQPIPNPNPSRPIYTSSMTNLATGTNLLAPKANNCSTSMFDLSREPPNLPSQWSEKLTQRHPSTTSTNASASSSTTNPILKKTSSNVQNELAVSAMRAAKSMNDLTAINTKLNECVSWTLPSAKRRSICA